MEKTCEPNVDISEVINLLKDHYFLKDDYNDSIKQFDTCIHNYLKNWTIKIKDSPVEEINFRLPLNKELTDLVKKIHDLNGVKETETFIVHSTVKDKPEEPFKKALAT